MIIEEKSEFIIESKILNLVLKMIEKKPYNRISFNNFVSEFEAIASKYLGKNSISY